MNINKNDLVPYLNMASEIFKKTNYKPSNNDIRDLAENMFLLEKRRGLSNLNKRLMEVKGKIIWDTITEHGFALMLDVSLDEDIPVYYEDNKLGKRPDFRVIIKKVTYWLQVKNLSDLERRNRANAIKCGIERELRKIVFERPFRISLFLSVPAKQLVDPAKQLTKKDIPEIVKFIVQCVKNAIEEEYYFFPNDKEPKAKISFNFSNKPEEFTHEIFAGGDIDIVNETGLHEKQINESFKNAANAFQDVDQSRINLIVAEADNKFDSDICDAVFGAKFGFLCQGKHYYDRGNSGFFSLSNFQKKVAGVIIIKRKKSGPLFDYSSRLLLNDNFKNRLCDINELISCDNIIDRNMSLSMADGNFEK